MLNYRNKPIKYNPEIREFLELCGYKKTTDDSLPGGMMFFNAHGDVAIQIWGNKITVSRYENAMWITKGHYIGFDGQNVPFFMMLMHVMGAIDLNQVKARSDEELKEALAVMKQPAAACAFINNNHKFSEIQN
jgi:hypothetical protein